MKPLQPSLREKKRYIAFEVMAEGISREDAAKAIFGRLSRYLGEVGMAKAGIIMLPDWNGHRSIMRVAASEVDAAKAGLALLKEAGGKAAAARSIGVSGTLEKARSKYMNGG